MIGVVEWGAKRLGGNTHMKFASCFQDGAQDGFWLQASECFSFNLPASIFLARRLSLRDSRLPL